RVGAATADRLAGARIAGGSRLARLGPQSQLQSRLNPVEQVELHVLADRLGDLLQVAVVEAGDEDFLHAGAVRGQALLLDPADGEHIAAQGDFAGHGRVVFHQTPGDEGGQCDQNRHTGRGPVLGRGTRGDVDVEVKVGKLLVLHL